MTRDITSNPVLKILTHSNYSTLETFGQWEINKIPIFLQNWVLQILKIVL